MTAQKSDKLVFVDGNLVGAVPAVQQCDRPPYFGNGPEDEWDPETGKPGIALFGNAVQVWSILKRNKSVRDVAAAFGVPPDMVRRAIAWHYWMILDEDGETFDHEGD